MVHATVGDRTRPVYTQIDPGPKGAITTEFLTIAAEQFTSHGISRGSQALASMGLILGFGLTLSSIIQLIPPATNGLN